MKLVPNILYEDLLFPIHVQITRRLFVSLETQF